MFVRPINLLAIAACVAMACGNPVSGASDAKPGARPATADGTPKVAQERGYVVNPPFAITDELTGLLIVWFDADGPHTASSRSEIPEAHRRLVRVDSLRVAPDKRLDPDHVYLADLTRGGTTSGYPVRVYTREFFDAQVQAARPAPPPVHESAHASASGDVTIYGASWCSACRGAAAYLEAHHVPFVEKDIEKDAQANAEMQQKARAAGKTPHGIPVIDFRGEIMLGFSEAELDRLIAQPPQPI